MEPHAFGAPALRIDAPRTPQSKTAAPVACECSHPAALFSQPAGVSLSHSVSLQLAVCLPFLFTD